MPFDTTPPFMQGTVPGSGQNQQNQMAKLAQILQMFGKGTPQQGGQNPVISPAHVGQLIQPFRPGQQGGGGGMAAPPGAPTPNQPQSQGPPESGLYKSGFEFNTSGGRDAAVVTSAIQGVSQFLSQAKQKKEQKTKATAENYMSQIMAAQQAGDQETLNLLLQDPKVVSTLEKGLNYLMPKVPGEPPPAEALGVHSAITKLSKKQQSQQRLPAPNTPGGVSFPRMPQSASNESQMKDVITKAALEAVKNDPTLAQKLGIGTTLSGAETKQAEQWAAGLGISPAQQAAMAQDDKKLAQTFSMFKIENETELKKLASTERMSSARNATELKAASISAGPMYERAKIARSLGEAQIKYREAMAKGQQTNANKIAMTTLTSQIDNLNTLAEKAAKDNNEALSKTYKSQADDLSKQYKEIKDSQDTDVNKIIEQILGPS